MHLDMTIANAFAKGPFTGNPAAVIVTERPLAEPLMQQIAEQNNLAETVYVVTGEPPWTIRWFTPTREIDLCGHATLAAAQVLWVKGYSEADRLEFASASGPLGVARRGEQLELDFPARPADPASAPTHEAVAAALDVPVSAVVECRKNRQLMVVLDSAARVEALRPDLSALASLDEFAVMVTARASQVDFVCRFFAPNAGINEDPVTGSAYTTLAPYWSEKLGASALRARQLSARGGWVSCRCEGDRVLIGGAVAHYLDGTITV